MFFYFCYIYILKKLIFGLLKLTVKRGKNKNTFFNFSRMLRLILHNNDDSLLITNDTFIIRKKRFKI